MKIRIYNILVDFNTGQFYYLDLPPRREDKSTKSSYNLISESDVIRAWQPALVYRFKRLRYEYSK